MRPLAEKIAAELDNGLVKRIDEIDNGVSVDGPVKHDSLAFAALVGDFNPSWDSPSKPTAQPPATPPSSKPRISRKASCAAR